MRRTASRLAAALLGILFLAGCGGNAPAGGDTLSTAEIIGRAKREGALNSVGMPSEWANWKGVWSDLEILYQIDHRDTDMGSAEELSAFRKGTADIGDVSREYAKIAEAQKLTRKYKTPYWNEVPVWAKDDDGDWIVTYTGTLAFMVNGAVAKEMPATWKAVLKADYKVALDDPVTYTTGQYAVYAAAIAMGGSAKNLQPGIDFFKALAKRGRLVTNCITCADFLKSGAGVQPKWDFIALGFRDQAAALKRPVGISACIPGDGSVTVGYATIINADARHSYAAMAAQEYILSDAGQLDLARGYATPIRPVKLPQELLSKRIPSNQYTQAMVKSALTYTPKIAQTIAEKWSVQISPLLKGDIAK